MHPFSKEPIETFWEWRPIKGKKKQNLEGDYMIILSTTFKVEKSDFLLLDNPHNNS